MNNDKSQLRKRIKWLRIGLFAGVFLIVLLLGQLVFYFAGNFKTFMYGLQLILWTIFTTSNWFQYKKVKAQLQENEISRA